MSGDQRAVLQLICERGQSYGDIAGLLGTDPDGVRERARAALEAMGGRDPDADVALTDYLLGQADAIGRADVARYLQQDPETLDLAADLSAKLQVLAPSAELPRLPARKAGARARGTTAAKPAPADEATIARRRLLAGLGVAAAVLVVVILAITGALSGDDSETPQTAAEDQAAAEETVAEEQTISAIDLLPAGGSGVGGTAEFGISEEVLFVDLQLDGLRAPREDEIYLVWLMAEEGSGYPLPTELTPDGNGSLGGRIAVPAPVTASVAPIAQSVSISRTDRNDLNSGIQAAQESNSPLLPYVGDELAAGVIPKSAAPAPEG